MLVIHIVAKIIENHIAVEDSVPVTEALFCETVVVVPRTHFLNHSLNVTVGRQHTYTLIIGEHLADILCREAQHLVQFRHRRCIPPDVETAGQVIQGDRAHSCQKDALEHALEQFEDFPVETACVGHLVVNFLPVFVQNHISEIVVLIYEQVERNLSLHSHIVDQIHLLHKILRGKNLFNTGLGIIIPVGINEIIQPAATVGIESLRKSIDVACDTGEVHIQHLIAVTVRRRMLTDVQLPEQPLEVRGGCLVIVKTQHIQEQALAETARADENQCPGLFLKFFNIH